MDKLLKRVIVLVAIVVIFGGMVLFFALSGKITTEISNGSLTVSAYYISKTAAAKSVIGDLNSCTIEFVENYTNDGRTDDGASFIKIKAGKFNNSDYGEYVLYRYKRNKSVIIIDSGHTVYVINAKNKEETLKLYNKLKGE